MKRLYDMTPNNIWDQAQNKPTLVVKDLKELYPDIDENVVYEVLLRRGVFKWLAVRREIIKLKNIWRSQITQLNRRKTQQEKGFLKALEMCRGQARKLCHSARWKSPDFDRRAKRWLEEYGEQL